MDLKKKKINNAHQISIKNNTGIDELVNMITKHFHSLSPRENAYLTQQRHIQGVKKAVLALQRLTKVNLNNNPELAAEDLRVAATSIGSITNIIDVEEILDDIFNSFCIGK
jgi:tRNA modification GTPase